MSIAVRIKICGVRDASMARIAVDAGADAVGVVFVPESVRCVDERTARGIVEAVAGRALVVGVFRDEPAERIAALARAVGLDEVQLHGKQGADEIAALAPIATVRAAAFEAEGFEDAIKRWNRAATSLAHLRALLVDTPDPSRVGGGTGAAFDWSALREALERSPSRLPIILAGGLTAGNVGEAIDRVRPWGVDVSSGVEIARGIKDAEKVRRFCEAVREA